MSSTTCDPYPTRGYGLHGDPQEDGSLAFAMLEVDKVVDSLCPGAEYNFSVTFPLNAQIHAYMTATSGEFGNPFSPSCPNQVVTGSADFVEMQYLDSYIVDCSETGDVIITVTWARNKTDYYHRSSITLPVNEACKLEPCTQPSTPTPVSSEELMDSEEIEGENTTDEEKHESEEMEGEGTTEEGELGRRRSLTSLIRLHQRIFRQRRASRKHL
eukprot:gene941-36020_t